MARRPAGFPDLSHIHPELRRFARPIDKLLLDPQNARGHSAENIAAIRESLREHGQVRAAIVTREELVLHEGHPAVPAGTVLVGNGMVTAARELGWRTVAAITFEGGAVEARKLALRDNRTAELASWVVPNLVADLRSLQALDVKMPDLGWADAQLDALIAEAGGGGGEGGDVGGGKAGEDPGAQPDRAAELQAKWGTQAGQLWEIPSKAVKGKVHRLLCGDSTRAEDVARVMAGEKANLCFTSPPYNLGTSTGGGFPKSGGMWQTSGLENGYVSYSDAMPQKDYFEWQARLLSMVWNDVLSDDGAIFYNHRPRVQDGILITPLTWNPGLPVRQIVIWNSGAGINFAPTHYRPAHEWIVIFAKPGFRLASKGDSGCGDVWNFAAAATTRVDGHPAPFPVDLPRRALETTETALMFEPYCGSGTCIVAAEQSGARCNAIEIAPGYVAVALERLAGMGLKPRRAK